MTWGAVAGAAVGVVGSVLSSRSASRASGRAADTAVAGEQARLDYLKERERTPLAYRDQALQMLAQEFGLSPQGVGVGDDGRQITGYSTDSVANPAYRELQEQIEATRAPVQRAILSGRLKDTPEFLEEETPIYGDVIPAAGGSPILDRAKKSPIYDAIMATRGAGEESILRQGQFRGLGSRAKDISGFNQNLEEKALLTAYNQQLQGLGQFTGYQGFAPQIAQGMSNIGGIQSQGQLASAQAMQQGIGGAASSIGGALEAYFNRPQSGGI